MQVSAPVHFASRERLIFRLVIGGAMAAIGLGANAASSNDMVDIAGSSFAGGAIGSTIGLIAKDRREDKFVQRKSLTTTSGPPPSPVSSVSEWLITERPVKKNDMPEDKKSIL